MPGPSTQTKPETNTDTEQPVPWNVVLLDDDHHTYDYVIRMMQEIFSHSLDKAYQLAKTVDADGRVVCLTTHKEHAELKRDQILAFGPDKYIAGCKGSMSAIIEPAEFGGDDDDDFDSGND